MQELLSLLTEHGSELSLVFMILFSLYQMYSPNSLPDTKGQKFIRRILEVLERINSQEGGSQSTSHEDNSGTE